MLLLFLVYMISCFISYNPVIQGYYDLRIAICGVKGHVVVLGRTHCILPQEQHRTSMVRLP